MEDNNAVVILGAVGTLLSIVIGALGGMYLKILAERNKMARDEQAERNKAALAEKELDLKAKKEDAAVARSRETIKELNEAIDQLGADRDADREQMHLLRDQLNSQGTELAVCKVKLQVCEEDRVELRTHLLGMAEEMRKGGMFVPRIPPIASAPDPPKGV